MSSRYDGRRRDRSRDRERDRGPRYVDRDAPPRKSRSRSPPRRGERDRGGRGPSDRRDYDREREYARDDRRRDERDRRDYRDDKRDARGYDRDYPRRDIDKGKERDTGYARDRDAHRGPDRSHDSSSRPTPGVDERHPSAAPDGKQPDSRSDDVKSRHVSEVPAEEGEEGEAMDVVNDANDDDAGMMAAMGLTGFGSTKGKHVEGNQEGGVDVKKIRTWRQYMNRRGGFNRPLDKIK